jgi:hypothetical protein
VQKNSLSLEKFIHLKRVGSYYFIVVFILTSLLSFFASSFYFFAYFMQESRSRSRYLNGINRERLPHSCVRPIRPIHACLTTATVDDDYPAPTTTNHSLPTLADDCLTEGSSAKANRSGFYHQQHQIMWHVASSVYAILIAMAL